MKPHLRSIVKHAVIWQVALVCYWLVLFITTHIPRDMAALPGPSTDKLIHFTAFALLAILLSTAWQLTVGPLGLRHFAWAWVLLVLYGALDEWTQSFVGRTASVWDLAGDALGALTGLMMFVALRRLFHTRLQRAVGSERAN
jgi:VanZ family protein